MPLIAAAEPKKLLAVPSLAVTFCSVNESGADCGASCAGALGMKPRGKERYGGEEDGDGNIWDDGLRSKFSFHVSSVDGGVLAETRSAISARRNSSKLKFGISSEGVV